MYATPPFYLSVTEYADLHNRPRSTVKRWIEKGQLPAVRIGRQWAIEADTPPPVLPQGAAAHKHKKP